MKPVTTTQTQARKPYIRRTEAQWKALIEAYESSGQTQEAFCREHGIAQSGLHAWRKRLRSPGDEIKASTPLIDITSQLASTMSTTKNTTQCQVELEIGGCLVRISTG